MIELNISSSLRKRSIDEEKVILQAAGASRGGDSSLGETIKELVEQKFEECKDDPNQFNSTYAFAKTRHMLDRYNFLLALGESEENMKEEMRRFYTLTTVHPVILMSQYFSTSNQADRFSWAGRLGCAEATLMYDTMQIIFLHPGATLDQFKEKIEDPKFVKLLRGLESTYNESQQETSTNRAPRNDEPKPQESNSAKTSGGGCMLVVIAAFLLGYIMSIYIR